MEQIFKKIKQIEKAFEIDEFLISGVNLWPLIRAEIIQQLRPADFGKKNKHSVKSYLYHFIDFFKTLNLWRMKGHNLFLLYGTDQPGKIKFNNELIDKHFSPFKEKFSPQKINFIEFGYIDPTMPKFGALNITFLYNFLKPLIKIYIKIKLYRKLTSNSFLRKFDAIGRNGLSGKIEEFFTRETFFTILLKVLKPNNVFVKSFHNFTTMALVNAANELNINTIEYQHGQQGENSLMYSNWNNVPKEGFKMLPKFFWVWEKGFRKKFDGWMENQNFHQVIVGGNLWYDYFFNKKKPKYIQLDKGKIYVLYCLQYTKIHKIILEAMKEDNNFCWLIRLHPRERNKIQHIKEYLKKNRIPESSFELEIANSYTFEELISSVEAVVSEWSTVLYEGYCFEKKAITITDFGKEAYKEFISEKKILYAANKSELNKLILSNFKIDKNQFPFFKADAVKFLDL